ncbi:MAG: 30S ribosome-binding factor RbfA [Kofleriaceae bacterium]|nr:30S ribosome-binding factor RbfA [Kofleriaceae bacterium]
MSSGNPRRPRVAQAIREALADLIRDELSDPRITKAGFVSINHVELNKDMGVAHVYVAFYGGDDRLAETAVKALVRAAAKLRGPLGRSLSLQRAPEIRFQHDQSGEFGMRLSEIIRHDEDLRTKAGPLDEDTGDGESSEDSGSGNSGPGASGDA